MQTMVSERITVTHPLDYVAITNVSLLCELEELEREIVMEIYVVSRPHLLCFASGSMKDFNRLKDSFLC